MEPQSLQPQDAAQYHAQRQAFHHTHSSIGGGSAGHWIKMAGILSPLIIGELVKDSEKRWRWIRIVSVAAALTAEGFHTRRITKERDNCEQRSR
jgi:hypothetical protein